MARPTKFTPETREAILKAVRAGNTRETSAAYAGVSLTAFMEWLARGRAEIERLEKPGARKRKSEAAYAEFAQALLQADARAETGHVGVLASAANKGEWRASLEWLRRMRRRTWGDNVDVTSGGEAVKMPAPVVFAVVPGLPPEPPEDDAE